VTNKSPILNYGLQAGNDLEELTWKRCAGKFVDIVEKHKA
jgi:hypothetical protein